MSPRHIFGSFCILLGGLCIGTAAATWAAQKQAEKAAGDRSDQLLFSVVQTMLISGAQGETDPLQTETESETFLPFATVNGYPCIGILSFPTLELELPVLADCTEALLETAPCRQYGTAAGENLVIAGHNYRRHFKRLRELAIGDSVYFTDISGKNYHYTVRAFETLLPAELDRMLAGDWALSLYTCTAGGEKRLTVRCAAAASID